MIVAQVVAQASSEQTVAGLILQQVAEPQNCSRCCIFGVWTRVSGHLSRLAVTAGCVWMYMGRMIGNTLCESIECKAMVAEKSWL